MFGVDKRRRCLENSDMIAFSIIVTRREPLRNDVKTVVCFVYVCGHGWMLLGCVKMDG